MYPVYAHLRTYRFVEGKNRILDLKKKKIKTEEEKPQFYGNAQIHGLGRSAGAEERHSSALYSRVCARAAQLKPVAATQARKPESQKKKEEQKERVWYYIVPTTADECQGRHPENIQHHNVLLHGATAKHR